MTYKVLTANRLSDGISVWYDQNGHWRETFNGVAVARTAEQAESLEFAGKQAFAANFVLDVNLIDVEDTESGVRPVRLRERIRAEGPSIEYVADNNAAKQIQAAA